MLYPLCLLFEIPWPCLRLSLLGTLELPCITCCFCCCCVSLTLAHTTPWTSASGLDIFHHLPTPGATADNASGGSCPCRTHCVLYSLLSLSISLEHQNTSILLLQPVSRFSCLGNQDNEWWRKKRSLWIAFLSFYYDSMNSETKHVSPKYSHRFEMVGKNVFENLIDYVLEDILLIPILQRHRMFCALSGTS